ncbi:MAG: hypothetical protein JNL74_20440, partial [Fibrobacteres bacterium]|nr:hypothetical protein [Fibrobacterota bacterium]
GVDLKQGLAYILSDVISVKFNAYGDSSFAGESLHVWIATRNISSRVFGEEGGDISLDKLGIKTDAASMDGTPIVLYDALLETFPVVSKIDASTIVKCDLAVNDYSGYRISPFTAFSGKANKPMTSLSYTNDMEKNSRVVKPGSWFGYSVSDLNKFNNSGFDTTKLSVVPIFGKEVLDVRFRRSSGWHSVNTDASAYLPLNDTLRNNYPMFLKSYQKKDVYHNKLRNVPYYLLDKYFGEAGALFPGKEFVIIAYTRGRYFKEPRVFLSSFAAPYKYVWDKTAPHISWSGNFNAVGSSAYAPLYYASPNGSVTKITNLVALNNVFDVHFTKDGTDGIVSAVRDVGYGKIRSVKLMFHFKNDAYTENPITGQRTYQDGQAPISYEKVFTGDDNIFSTLVFKGIDARGWKKGFWEMWVESADNLGNSGSAPFGGAKTIEFQNGRQMFRTIEIK